ncbi:MAG: GNAT family N-acetyltransferase [Chloroflexota bacterium]|nr:GNAT family N-acetyltransferase [Chloroflexota bacterium]
MTEQPGAGGDQRDAPDRAGAPSVVRLAEDHVEEAGELLARALHDDPFSRYVIPDPGTRPDSLPFLYEVGVRYGVLFGEVYAAQAPDGELRGVAVWLPPGQHRTTPERTIEAGFLDLGDRLDLEVLQRFAQVQGYVADVHERDAPADHWYLTLAGVEPTHQRHGLGAALLRPILARADADRIPCYLETFAEENIPFYTRHGFAVVTAGIEPTSGVSFWTIRREPLPGRSATD